MLSDEGFCAHYLREEVRNPPYAAFIMDHNHVISIGEVEEGLFSYLGGSFSEMILEWDGLSQDATL